MDPLCLKNYGRDDDSKTFRKIEKENPQPTIET